MTALINDESPMISKEFELRNCFGEDEKRVTNKILDSGHLSSFVGAQVNIFMAENM